MIASEYNNYEYISASPLFAKVKEEFKSYFDTGMVDDLLFPIWIKECLTLLTMAVYKKVPILLFVEDFQAKLPPDFKSVREAWMCTSSDGVVYQSPNSYYKKITTRVSDDFVPQEDNCPAPCDPCPLIIESIYKTTTQTPVPPPFQTTYLLRPGNISAINSCSNDCKNLGISSPDTFDIKDNKFVTNFRTATIYMVYYSNQDDEDGITLIPDNQRIKNALEQCIKYKIFEQLWNQVTDETYNQIKEKYAIYERKYNIAFLAAESEIKKQSNRQKVEAMIRQNKRLDKYNIK